MSTSNLADKKCVPCEGKVQAYSAAHARMRANEHFGKIVLTM